MTGEKIRLTTLEDLKQHVGEIVEVETDIFVDPVKGRGKLCKNERYYFVQMDIPGGTATCRFRKDSDLEDTYIYYIK